MRLWKSFVVIVTFLVLSGSDNDKESVDVEPFFEPRYRLEKLTKMARRGSIEEKHTAISDLGLVRDKRAIEILIWTLKNEKDKHVLKRARQILVVLFRMKENDKNEDIIKWWKHHREKVDIKDLDYMMSEFVYGQVGYPRGAGTYPHDVNLPPEYVNKRTYKFIERLISLEKKMIENDKENWIKRRHFVGELVQFLKEGTKLQREIAASDLRLIRSIKILKVLFDAEKKEKDTHVLWHIRVSINALLRLYGDGGDNIERARQWWTEKKRTLEDLCKNSPHDAMRDFTYTNRYNEIYTSFAYPFCKGKEYPKERFVDPIPERDTD